MTAFLLLAAIVLFLCIVSGRLASRTGLPVLICFIGLGMFFGADGPFGIYYSNMELTEQICTVALIFVMFYGGFGTKWETARPVAGRAILMSTAGVALTALFVTGFCTLALGIPWKESFLIGSVLSCTDAASVFSILRSRKLSLKYRTDSLLEVESGSNDPGSFMLTTIAISLILGENTSVIRMILVQVGCGAGIGVGLAAFARFILKKTKLITDGMDAVFLVAVALASYALPTMIGGNGYLSVYLTGIILGNSPIRNKKTLVPFFDGVTNLAQICIFFILGLLSFPTRLPAIAGTSIAIALFLLLAARPLMVWLLVGTSGAGLKHQCCISWAGLRGASSIVFAIYATAQLDGLSIDLFHIVFMVSLISVAVQGTFLPQVAGKLSMIDENANVLKTFTDYQEDSALTMMRMYIPEGHNWQNRRIREVSLPTDSLALMIRRGDETLIPRGNTKILAGDTIILSVPSVEETGGIRLREIEVDANHEWANKKIEELDLPKDVLIALVRRGEENMIPRGQTMILPGDIVVVYDV